MSVWVVDNLDVVLLGAIFAYAGLRLETLAARVRRVDVFLARTYGEEYTETPT